MEELQRQAILYRVFQIGLYLKDYELDEEGDEQQELGRELMALSGICVYCRGDGVDGDSPDAAGVGGGIWSCTRCNGTGKVDPLVPEN